MGGGSILPTFAAAAMTLSSITTLPEERTTLKLEMRPSGSMRMRRPVTNFAVLAIAVGCSQRPKKRSWICSW